MPLPMLLSLLSGKQTSGSGGGGGGGSGTPIGLLLLLTRTGGGSGGTTFDWPDATNTGVTGSLTAVPGSATSGTGWHWDSTDHIVQIDSDNATISNLDITGGIYGPPGIDGVTISNCRLTYNDFAGMDVRGSNWTITHCTIIGPGVSGVSGASSAALLFELGGHTITYNNISRAEHAIALGEGTCTITNNYMHHPDGNFVDKHIGGVSLKGGQDGVLVKDNTAIGWVTGDGQGNTSNVFIQDNTAAINDVTVEHNLLIGPTESQIYVESRFGNGTTNVTIKDNVLHKGNVSYYSIVGIAPTMSGNTDYDTGLPCNDPNS
jgi:hypothetical protein